MQRWSNISRQRKLPFIAATMSPMEQPFGCEPGGSIDLSSTRSRPRFSHIFSRHDRSRCCYRILVPVFVYTHIYLSSRPRPSSLFDFVKKFFRDDAPSGWAGNLLGNSPFDLDCCEKERGSSNRILWQSRKL